MFTHERDKLFGRNVEIFTPRVDRIDYRDSAETALRIARARSVTWVDAAGRREPWNSIWVSGARLVVDRMLEPVHLRRHLKALDALIREGPIRVPRRTRRSTAAFICGSTPFPDWWRAALSRTRLESSRRSASA